jgi:hypothetical protein
MKIEVDQSGKIEQTSWPTVVAFSNGTTGAVYIPAKEKRLILENLRTDGKQRYFPVLVFAAVVLLLIRKHSLQSTHMVIDDEYTGKQSVITDFITKHERITGTISFGRIGKKSRAHHYAITMYRLKKGSLIRAEEVVSMINKKDQI